MSVTRSSLSMAGAAMPRENPLPLFRDRNHDQKILSDGTLSREEAQGLGLHTGFRVLPYCMQDGYTLERTDRTYETVVLENAHMKATFLPELGGRLWSLFDKDKNRELLYRNPVFQPANLAIRNAWFSGGIEWNMGQLGHTYSTCGKVFCAKMQNRRGEEFLRIYDYVRTTGIFWQIDFHLPQDAHQLYAHVRMTNDGADPVPLYWWTNIAVPETESLRIFSEVKDVIYINPNTLVKEGAAHGYGHAYLPELPSMPGVDATYPMNSRYTNEFFFQNPKTLAYPWEAAAYEDGYVFLERSTQPLRIRKMFCWGTHTGGRNWQNHLSQPGEGAYVEIQAGLAPTQIHGMDFTPGATVEFTQTFGSMTVDAQITQKPDWEEARSAVEAAAEAAMPGDALEAAHQEFLQDADLPCGELLYLGQGWGCLEGLRRESSGEAPFPATISFPRDSMGQAEQLWEALLNGQAIPDLAPGQIPNTWMTDPKWEGILRRGLDRQPENKTILVQLGTLLYENHREEDAALCWQAAGEQAAALRNRSVYYRQKGQTAQAIAAMEQAFALLKSPELVQEYLTLLSAAQNWTAVWQAYESLSPETAADERVMLSATAAAVALDKTDFLEMAFAYPYADIREGATQMTDLWFRYEAMKEGKKTGRTDLEALEQTLRTTLHPPLNIDYRLT